MVDFDCYHLGMYSCDSNGKCQDCSADFDCQQQLDSDSPASNKIFCDTRFQQRVCTACMDSSDLCCSSNRDCGNVRYAPECKKSLHTCGPCTSNASCQTFGLNYCVRGECLPKFNYTSLPNCIKYDSLGYCAGCETGFSLHNK